MVDRKWFLKKCNPIPLTSYKPLHLWSSPLHFYLILTDEWRQVVTRLGRWIDFDNDYKTLYPWFMESVWWVFKELYTKGLVYKGYKVMPFSTACSTPLSNFESGQNYKDVVDPAVVVRFPLLDKGDEGR